jgi:DNA-binding MarR family transcriptional regulator
MKRRQYFAVCSELHPSALRYDHCTMKATLPLPTLLSHVLVAFTIEFDNEAERLMGHRTTRHGATAGSPHAPWLVSLVMWSNCMRFVDEAGVPGRELERRARTKTNLRWGYVTVAPDPKDRRPKPPRSAWLVRSTAAGRKAQQVWGPLFGSIEQRWEERFGKAAIERLRDALRDIVSQLELALPDCLPILGYGLSPPPSAYERRELSPRPDTGPLTLVALLSRVLLAFAIDFEAESDLSLAITANVVRVLDEPEVRVRDLPSLTGVSKEAIAVSLSFLTKRGYATVKSDPSNGQAKLASLTAKGLKTQDEYCQLLSTIEDRWQKRFGRDSIRALRDSLEQLVGEPTAQGSPLFLGLQPHPEGWRASVPRPNTLPHFPLVLHRGGFPDGS